MSTRIQNAAGESLSEALSRVIVTRQAADHSETYEWATQEGRGDRMPRFLERAIEDVPHAARGPRPGRGQQIPSRRPVSKATLLMSTLAVGVGIGISLSSPSGLGPFAQRLLASTSFATQANAATPRMAFGEALMNYSEKANAEATVAHVTVRNLAPGATLSAGERVSDTEWSVAQSDLDNLVITFPRSAEPDAVHASVEIPAVAKAADGTFNVELRQASTDAAPETAAAPADAVPAAAPEATPVSEPQPAVEEGSAEEAAKPAAKPASTKPLAKRKSKPTASYIPKKPAEAPAKSMAAKLADKLAALQSKEPAEPKAASGPGLFGLGALSSLTPNPNQLTMFSLGGPVAD